MIHHGDCLDILPALEANSVDAVVTDPPYGLSFMDKDWDHGVPGVEFWKAAMRVMKPGAFLLAFGGTRTFHRLTCAIEDAGLEIRDCMMWLYGSGFPKSHDVSKAIDKTAGEVRPRNVIPEPRSKLHGDRPWMNDPDHRFESKEPISAAAAAWSGWGTALKPAWEPIIVARKPLEGAVAENVLKWGTGGMNIDGGRIESDGTHASSKSAGLGSGHGTHEGHGKYNGVGGVIMPPNPKGRWPANVILDEEAGAMLDGQTQHLHGAGFARESNRHGDAKGMFSMHGSGGHRLGDTGGASRFFYCAKASKRERNAGLESFAEINFSGGGGINHPKADAYGARKTGQNTHPTVKPISLLIYLIKVVTPPGGIVLDPFLGSGSTLVATERLGLKGIGIEREETYCEIARKRIGNEVQLELAVNQ